MLVINLRVLVEGMLQFGSREVAHIGVGFAQRLFKMGGPLGFILLTIWFDGSSISMIKKILGN